VPKWHARFQNGHPNTSDMLDFKLGIPCCPCTVADSNDFGPSDHGSDEGAGIASMHHYLHALEGWYMTRFLRHLPGYVANAQPTSSHPIPPSGRQARNLVGHIRTGVVQPMGTEPTVLHKLQYPIVVMPRFLVDTAPKGGRGGTLPPNIDPTEAFVLYRGVCVRTTWSGPCVGCAAQLTN
jgi:hypothetical protein